MDTYPRGWPLSELIAATREVRESGFEHRLVIANEKTHVRLLSEAFFVEQF